MKQKVFGVILLLLVPLFLLTGCTQKEYQVIENLTKVKIIIVDDNKKELYNQEIETNKKYLIDVLKDKEEVKLKYENSDYGAYITSLMGIDQKTDNKKMYYWSYYIDEEYAEVGVSNCEIKEGSTYKFVYEYYES
jgi:hypothetical protein